MTQLLRASLLLYHEDWKADPSSHVEWVTNTHNFCSGRDLVYFLTFPDSLTQAHMKTKINLIKKNYVESHLNNTDWYLVAAH